MRIKLPSNEQILFLANVLVNRFWFKQNPKNLKSILVLRWDEIGDMAASAHVFTAIKKTFPAAQLTVLCKPFVKPLIAQVSAPVVVQVAPDTKTLALYAVTV